MKNRNKIKSFLLLFISLQLFFAHINLAYAQTYSGVESQIKTFLCTPTDARNATPGNNPAANDLFTCVNKLYRFAIAAGSVMALFFIVISGYLWMSSDGNQETVDKAKSIFASSITAMVILFGGYVLLRALNPDLLRYNPIQPPDVTGLLATQQMPGAGTSPSAGAPAADAVSAAKVLLSLNGSKLTIQSTGDCQSQSPQSTPLANVQAMANSQPATYDGPGTTCNVGKVSLSLNMLNAITNVANSGINFTITSLATGHHAATTDPHYQGKAADLVPNPANANNQASLISALKSNGANVIAIECDLNRTHQYLTVPAQAQPNSTTCIGFSGYHIHAQWQ
ncbi:MAG: hypothetical protein KGJ93_01620 [Patescibacteria group bacterium]|nr:hypothetical protein [Patescibacteria group bacterium]